MFLYFTPQGDSKRPGVQILGSAWLDRHQQHQWVQLSWPGANVYFSWLRKYIVLYTKLAHSFIIGWVLGREGNWLNELIVYCNLMRKITSYTDVNPMYILYTFDRASWMTNSYTTAHRLNIIWKSLCQIVTIWQRDIFLVCRLKKMQKLNF